MRQDPEPNGAHGGGIATLDVDDRPRRRASPKALAAAAAQRALKQERFDLPSDLVRDASALMFSNPRLSPAEALTGALTNLPRRRALRAMAGAAAPIRQVRTIAELGVEIQAGAKAGATRQALKQMRSESRARTEKATHSPTNNTAPRPQLAARAPRRTVTASGAPAGRTASTRTTSHASSGSSGDDSDSSSSDDGPAPSYLSPDLIARLTFGPDRPSPAYPPRPSCGRTFALLQRLPVTGRVRAALFYALPERAQRAAWNALAANAGGGR